MAAGQGDHPDPRHQHRLGPAVEARAGEADLADRGGDRRVQRYAEGDPAGHHRHVPGADDQAEGRLPAPGALRLPRLGPDRLRRGASAARAGLQVHRRPAGPAPARADRDARAGGRPRVGRLLAHRAEAVRRAVEGDRGAGLHRARRLRRGPGQPHRLRAAGVRDRRDRRRSTASARRPRPSGRSPRRWCAGSRGSRSWSSASTSTSSTSWAST